MSHAEDIDDTRRDFLYYATAGVGVVVTGAAVWPLINQMNPSADVTAMSSILVDISGVEVGTQLTVKYHGKPVFIRRRSQPEIEAGRAVPLEDLVDPIDYVYEDPNHKTAMPALDQNRTMDKAGQWLVMIGVCTHLGCIPIGDAGDYVASNGEGGWFCPCHGSHYDTAGRIRKGPAPRNLDIPLAKFTDDSTIKLG